jgi:hypothetical protein
MTMVFGFGMTESFLPSDATDAERARVLGLCHRSKNPTLRDIVFTRGVHSMIEVDLDGVLHRYEPPSWDAATQELVEKAAKLGSIDFPNLWTAYLPDWPVLGFPTHPRQSHIGNVYLDPNSREGTRYTRLDKVDFGKLSEDRREYIDEAEGAGTFDAINKKIAAVKRCALFAHKHRIVTVWR